MYAHLCVCVCVYTYIIEYNSNDKKLLKFIKF